MRLLTWNVQWCRGLDGPVDPSRIVREARRLADPDVLCLQEINVGFADLPGSRVSVAAHPAGVAHDAALAADMNGGSWSN